MVAGAGTLGVMLVGVGALAAGMGGRPSPGGRAAPSSSISPLDDGPLTSFETPGLFTGPDPGSPQDVAPSVVGIDGARSGSGVVVEGDGIVLTSADVVGNLPDVTVTFLDGSTRTGTNLGTDPVTNLAIVDLPGGGFSAARLLAADDLTPGDQVLCATSDDDGFRAVGATVEAPRAAFRPEDGPVLDGLVQIAPDAATSAQRLGSPVVDGGGAVVAVVTSRDGSSYYATPIDVARKVANDVLDRGAPDHATLGILGTDASPGHDPAAGGVQLAAVTEGGPVDGVLRPGDVITALDDDPAVDMSTLVSLVQLRSPGDEVDVTYRRAGRTEEVTVELAEHPAPAAG